MSMSTATGARNKEAYTIIFKDKQHKEFYIDFLPRCRYQDVYHRALVYCLGLSSDTRAYVRQIYDFETGNVKPECKGNSRNCLAGRLADQRQRKNYPDGIQPLLQRDAQCL